MEAHIPPDSTIAFNEALAALEQEKPTEAQSFLQECIDFRKGDANTAPIQQALGDTNADLGNLLGAVSHYQHAIRIAEEFMKRKDTSPESRAAIQKLHEDSLWSIQLYTGQLEKDFEPETIPFVDRGNDEDTKEAI